MIVIAAGRRIDALDAKEERFPLKNADRVAKEIRARLQDFRADMLVCSAACGADLITLNEAQSLGIRRRIVLPFAPQRFRQVSVVDRPGNSTWNWGALFDEIIRRASETNDLIIMPPKTDETAAYVATNKRILAEALNLSQDLTDQTRNDTDHDQLTAMIIWEGISRGEDDLTADFAMRAQGAGIPIEEVITL
jgi:hypothetical protein